MIQNLVAIAFLFATVPAWAEDAAVQVHGFIDAQLQTQIGSTNSPGFVLNDSAVMFSKEFSNIGFQLDLPFSGSPVAFNELKAQAFVSYRHDSHFSWKLGKFDAPLGVEGSKSTQIDFTKQGLSNTLLPTSLTGATLQYDFSPKVKASVIVADPTNLGSLRGGSYDLGARVDAEIDTAQSWLAILYNESGTIGTVFDMGLAFQISKFKIDFGFSYLSATQTSVVIAKPILTLTEKLNAGVRFEYANSAVDTSGVVTGAGSTLQITTGLQYKLTPELLIKVDHTYRNATPSSICFGTVFKF